MGSVGRPPEIMGACADRRVALTDELRAGPAGEFTAQNCGFAVAGCRFGL
jgi:hypothetical protein